MTRAALAEAVGGDLVGPDPDALVGPDVVRDSRDVTPGAVFCAIVGERVDGHRFVAPTFSSGAGTALVERDRWPATGEQADLPVVRVADVPTALGRLGRHVVDDAKHHGLAVVAITGSMGKTSTKDLLGQLLAAAGPTVAPENSFNNEIGVPLTATRIDDRTRFLVSEMGARGIGHIADLCALVPPDIGVVLNVAHAHLGEFGSQAAIARAKGELVEAAGRWAVLNADDPLVLAMRDRTAARVITFSVDPDTEPVGDAAWAADLQPDEWGRYRFTVHLRLDGHHHRGTAALGVPGRHNVANAMAAAAAALVAGVPPELITTTLDGAQVTSQWRMALTELADTTMVLNDAYNANPDAVLAALDTAAQMAGGNGRRLGVVLGDMLELGEESATEHHRVGAAVATAGASWALFVGDLADEFATGARTAGLADEQVVVAPDAATAADRLVAPGSPLAAGDVVLVKGSRGVALEQVAAALESVRGAAERAGGTR
ncbi:UDP-N-acetylmuramoyl-tripeptide--D-alanyl-D-alanine ligase [Propionibacteriaceae bacterium Y2011]